MRAKARSSTGQPSRLMDVTSITIISVGVAELLGIVAAIKKLIWIDSQSMGFTFGQINLGAGVTIIITGLALMILNRWDGDLPWLKK